MTNGPLISTERGLAMLQVVDLPAVDFISFYQMERARAIGLAYVLSGSTHSAEDIAQDAFVAALSNWTKVSRLEKPEAWLNRVVCNQSVSRFRKSVREAKALLRLQHSTQDYVVMAEDDVTFWRAVRALPKRQAQAIALYYVNDMSVADIAVVLRCSEGSVKTHLSRGRQAVARELELQ